MRLTEIVTAADYITIQLPAGDTLSLIGICAREENQAFHFGDDKSRTVAYDLRMELRSAMKLGGGASLLPKNDRNDCTL